VSTAHIIVDAVAQRRLVSDGIPLARPFYSFQDHQRPPISHILHTRRPPTTLIALISLIALIALIMLIALDAFSSFATLYLTHHYTDLS
jgi:hypothetical protein